MNTQRDHGTLIIPSQLRHGREVVQATLEEVGRELSVRAGDVESWEQGVSAPTLNQLEALAGLYGRDIDYFLGETPPPPESIEFRAGPGESFSGLSRQTRSIAGRFDELCRRAVELEALVGKRRECQISRLDRSLAPGKAATRLRQDLGVGDRPMANLKDLLDAKGFRIFELPVPNDELSGLSLWHSDYGPCILLNARDLKPRRNFTLAHELAHLLYSHGALACRIPPKLEEQAVGTERKADHFAVELLLPESTLRADFTKRGYSSTPSAEELRPMRSKWGVSLQALGYRLETLGLIARGHTDALVEPKPTYFRRPKTPKWERRLGKPFIETAFEAYQKNLVSIGKLAHSLGIPIRKAMEEVERRSK